jgi:hypothetical protein
MQVSGQIPPDKRYFLAGTSSGQDIAERNILEAFVLTDVVVIWNVDAGGNTRGGKGDDIERGKIGAEEGVFFECRTRRQLSGRSDGTEINQMERK